MRKIWVGAAIIEKIDRHFKFFKHKIFLQLLKLKTSKIVHFCFLKCLRAENFLDSWNGKYMCALICCVTLNSFPFSERSFSEKLPQQRFLSFIYNIFYLFIIYFIYL